MRLESKRGTRFMNKTKKNWKGTLILGLLLLFYDECHGYGVRG